MRRSTLAQLEQPETNAPRVARPQVVSTEHLFVDCDGIGIFIPG